MFGFGKNSFLGIDIGTSTIKIVEIKASGGKPVLSNYGWIRIASSKIEADPAAFEGEIAGHIKRILQSGAFRSRNAFVSIPSFGGLITLIDFPDMQEADFEQAIRFEASKYIPTSLDDVVLSWDVVNKQKEGKLIDKLNAPIGKEDFHVKQKVQVLLVAAPKNKVVRYENIIKTTGLKLNAIEIESFSLVRSLLGNDQGNFMIVDIGARVCNIILIEKGVVRVNRNIDAGGRDITNALAHGLGIDEERAEKLKISGKDFLNTNANIIFPILDTIVDEIKRVINSYYKDDAANKLDSLILSGGTSAFSGIDNYFSKSIGIRTLVGNPFSRIEYDPRLEGKLGRIKGQFSVCIGLALKGFEEYLRK